MISVCITVTDMISEMFTRMSHRGTERLVAAVLVLVVCSQTLYESQAQSTDPAVCRRQCEAAVEYFSRFSYSRAYLDNYLQTCYGRCPSGTTSPPVTRTTTSSYRTSSCGVQPTFRNRVIQGQDAGECEFPWMVAVSINTLFCGGAILDRRHILTAAHCLKDRNTGVIASANSVFVRVGSSLLSRLQVYQVSQVMVDPRHVPVINDYDVTVLRLTRELTYSDCVGPICLPQVWEDPRSAEYCVAAGWGTDNVNSPGLTQNLQSVQLPIVDHNLCVPSYGSTYVNQLKICAGDFYRGGRDTCQGDSGGPLMCKYDNRFVVMGIVSFGSGCARPRFPGIYTRVAHESILSFIQQSTRY